MARLALCEVRGLLVDLLDKLSGEDGSTWFVALAKFLRKENPWESVTTAAPEHLFGARRPCKAVLRDDRVGQVRLRELRHHGGEFPR